MGFSVTSMMVTQVTKSEIFEKKFFNLTSLDVC